MKLELEIGTDGIENLKRIMRLSGVNREEELFDTAVALLIWAVEQRAEGRKIASIDPEKEEYRELEIPLLQGTKEHLPEQRSEFGLKELMAGIAVGIFLTSAFSKVITHTVPWTRTLDENPYRQLRFRPEPIENTGTTSGISRNI
ncbi:MAG: hypothetical protein ACJ71W_00385 [Terriglobales bacterium]